jgi:hypothetical protein
VGERLTLLEILVPADLPDLLRHLVLLAVKHVVAELSLLVLVLSSEVLAVVLVVFCVCLLLLWVHLHRSLVQHFIVTLFILLA